MGVLIQVLWLQARAQLLDTLSHDLSLNPTPTLRIDPADELWSNLEEVGIERSAGGTRGGRAEDKLKHMVTKRCELQGCLR